MTRLLLLGFTAGLGTLGLETLWLRGLRPLLGATAPAAAAVLVAIFAGHALGSAWVAHRAGRTGDPPGLGRLALAAVGLSLWVLPALHLGDALLALVTDAFVDHPLWLLGLRLGLALGACLPAAAALGALLPALGAQGIGATRALGARGALLYAVHTLGAAVGAGLASFVAVEALGVRASYAAGLALLALVGLAAPRGAVAARKPASREPPAASSSELLGMRLPLALAALSGLSFLSFEILLLQAFAQVLNQSLHAFGALVVTVLVAMAIGAAAVSSLERWPRFEPQTALAFTLAASALAIAALPTRLVLATDGLQVVGSAAPGGYVTAVLGLAVRVAGPALILASGVLPLCFALGARAGAGAGSPAPGGSRFAWLLVANALGAGLAALLTPFALLPGLGLWAAFAALALVLAIAALAVPVPHRRLRLSRDLLLALGWVAVLGGASPLEVPAVRLEPGELLLEARTTPAGVVAVVEDARGRSLRIDNHYVLGGTAEQAHEERQGHLPALLHPEARRAAYVGAATGISAGALLLHPLDRITLVELVPGVVDAARRYFREANRGIYDDPRSRVVADDARSYLRATRERFDLIVADLFVPWRSGVPSLYTREHFETLRARLAEDGLFCQWLALYQLSRTELEILLATFLDVFPKAALFRGDFYARFPTVALVGWKGRVASPTAIGEATQRLRQRGVEDRWTTHPEGLFALYATSLSGLEPRFEEVPRQRDDRPRLETLAARGHAGGQRGKLDPLVGEAWLHLLHELAEAAPAERDPLSRLPPSWARARHAGDLLQRAAVAFLAGAPEPAGELLEEAAAALPPALLSAAAPDPSALEVWRD